MPEPKTTVRMTRSGFCAFPSTPEHTGCIKPGCVCSCHPKEMQ